MILKKRIKVLISKPGLDGHETGARLIARGLRDAGMEVIYTGGRQTAQMIVQTALQEDVDIIGLSILSGVHKEASADVLFDVLGRTPMNQKTVAEIRTKGVSTRQNAAAPKKTSKRDRVGPG